jgi:hypothetical protein
VEAAISMVSMDIRSTVLRCAVIGRQDEQGSDKWMLCMLSAGLPSSQKPGCGQMPGATVQGYAAHMGAVQSMRTRTSHLATTASQPWGNPWSVLLVCGYGMHTSSGWIKGQMLHAAAQCAAFNAEAKRCIYCSVMSLTRMNAPAVVRPAPTWCP